MCWNTGVCQFVQSLDRLKVSIGDLEVLQLPRFIRKNSVLRSATEQEVKLMRRLRTQASELDPVGARCFLGLAGPEAGGQITLSTLR
eukprot:g9684.t1